MAFVLFGAILLTCWLIGGWVLMLILGALHHSVWATVPALGFWQSTIVYIALSFIAGLLRGNK